MSMTKRFADMKRKERENVKRKKEKGGEMRERKFGTFSLLFYNLKSLFRRL